MKSTVTIEQNIEIDVEFEYRPATKSYYSTSHGNWLPGDPIYLRIISARIGSVEILDSLAPKDLNSIELAVLASLEDSDGQD